MSFWCSLPTLPAGQQPEPPLVGDQLKFPTNPRGIGWVLQYFVACCCCWLTEQWDQAEFPLETWIEGRYSDDLSFYRSKTVLDHDWNILDWSKIGFQFGLGLKTVFSFSELFWAFRRTWQYSDVLSFYRSKTVLDHDQPFFGPCQNNLILGSKRYWIGPKMTF